MTSTSAARIYLAPLRGISTLAFRTLFAGSFGGVDVAVAPFIFAPPNSEIRRAYLRDVDPARGQLMPVIPQIIGTDPAAVVKLCTVMAGVGIAEANLNFGCPKAYIMRKRRGAGVLEHPGLVEGLLERVYGESPIPVSIKARLGIADPRQLVGFAGLFNRFPIKELIIHPRVARQMYAGAVDLDEFARCLDAFEAPIVYNGDIRTFGDFERLRARFPAVRGWMIGRGLVADPFLAEAIKSGGAVRPDATGAMRRFVGELYADAQGSVSVRGHALARMKELWVYLGPSFCGSERLVKQILHTHAPDEYEALVETLLSQCAWAPGAGASGAGRDSTAASTGIAYDQS
jgi:tRNA-dihydrouridine synthase B